MSSKTNEERAVKLADGLHRLAPPTIGTLKRLQERGYTSFTVFEFLRGIDPTEYDGKTVAVDVDYVALVDHLCALLQQSEPLADWTVESVGDVMIAAETQTYIEHLSALGEAAFPKDDDEKKPSKSGEARSRSRSTGAK